MKKYVTPVLQFVTLRIEESIAMAVQGCDGACTEDIKDAAGKVLYYAHGS